MTVDAAADAASTGTPDAHDRSNLVLLVLCSAPCNNPLKPQ